MGLVDKDGMTPIVPIISPVSTYKNLSNLSSIGNNITDYWNTNVFGIEYATVETVGIGVNKTTYTNTEKSEIYTGNTIVVRYESAIMDETPHRFQLTINTPWNMYIKNIGGSINLTSSESTLFATAGRETWETGVFARAELTSNPTEFIRLGGKVWWQDKDDKNGFGGSVAYNPFAYAQAFGFKETKSDDEVVYVQTGAEARMWYVYGAVAAAALAWEFLVAAAPLTPTLGDLVPQWLSSVSLPQFPDTKTECS